MAQNKIVTDIEFNISKALKSIQTLRTSLSGKIDIIGVSAVQKAESGLHQIEQQIVKLQQKAPGIGATAQEFDKFYKETLKVTNGMDKLLGEFQGFQVTDDYLKENISALQQLSQEAIEASKRTKELKENIASTPISSYETKGQKQKSQQTERQMREYALQGDTEKIKETYATRGAEYKTLISDAKSSEDAGRVKTLIKDRNQLIAIEQKYLALARQVIVATQEEGVQAINLRTALDNAFEPAIQDLNELNNDLAQASSNLHQVQNSSYQANQEMLQVEKSTKAFGQLSDQITHLFSATSIFYMLRRVVRGAIQDFQELDKQFNEIAIVSDYSTSEMWKSFSTVNKTAQEFGVTTKNVLEVQNLYYHQGKDMAEVNKLTAQTLTLAKITGMDYERATSDLTAALNAYNIAAEDAVRVTDTIAAMDTNAAISSEELMTALTKTASIAANAGMSLESTEVFLTKMIETTREAPENLGTALKTIIARFGEVKQEIDGEEIELADINRVDTALKTIGISLLDTAGQIRDLDGVFMELSSKWDDLDRNTQRYIATIAAGSRQQSRFIAMMEDYDRTLELTEIAQNSAGLGAKQLAKAQESIETSVNRLKSSWQEFYQNIIKSGAIKTVLDTANTFLSVLNALPGPLGAVAAGVALWALKTKVLDKVLLTHKIINDGLVKGLTEQQITQNLMTALTQKRESALKTYIKTLIAYRNAKLANEAVDNADIANPSELLNQIAENEALEENTREQLKNISAKLANDAVDAAGATTSAIDLLNQLANNEALEEETRELAKNTAAQLENAVARQTNNTSTVTQTGGILSKVFGEQGGSLIDILKKVIGPLLGKIGGVISSIVSTLGGPLTIALATVAAALVTGIVLWNKYGKASLDDTKQLEKLQKAQENYNDTLKEYNNLKENIQKYEQYRNKENLTAEQLQEQQEAAKALVDEYPQLLSHIDEEGNYWLKDAAAIREVIAAKEELLDQEATNYTQLRLQYAKEGIYADTSTQAGKTMQNIQSYASTLDEDMIKDTAKKIDAAWQGISFNSKQYTKMMQAFAEGKKYSFDEKDMSNLFAGQIGEENWQEFLKIVQEEGIDFEDIDSLTTALDRTGAYREGNAKEVAEAFIKMNNENGKLFSQLIEGAAKEYSETNIQQAKIEIEKGDFEENLSSEVTDALSEVAVQLAIAKVGEKKWNNLDEEEQTERIKSMTDIIVSQFEQFTKSEIQGINAVFSSVNVGALEASKASSFDVNAIDKKAALKEFWSVLPEEIQRQFSEEQIQSLSTEVVEVLFSLIKEAIGDTNIDTLISGLVKDFETSKGKYKDGNFSADLQKFLEDSFTVDQVRALADRMGNLSEEQIAPYINTIINSYNEKIKNLNIEQKKILQNELIGTNFLDVESVLSSIDTLQELGYTTQEVANMMMSASNDVANITGLDFESVKKAATAAVETFSEGIESMGALLEGTASLDQMNSYLNSMKTYYTKLAKAGDTTALQAFSAIASSIQATGKGFKISTSAADAYGNSLYQTAIAAFDLQISLLKAELAMAEVNNDVEKMIELQAEIMMLELTAAQLDAQWKQARNDALIDSLEKAKEKADELLDSLKELVNWLMEFDRFANLDRISDGLDEEFEHLEYEINFSTNKDVIKKDIEDQITNLNTQIALNQGGLRAAEDEKAMRRDVIETNYSNYVSFDPNGKAIINAKQMQKLQEQIAKADESRKPVLQAEAEMIEQSVDAYNNAEDAAEKYSSALEDNFSDLEKVLKDTYQAAVDMEEKLIEVRMEQEDKHLKVIKDKYDAIKEENDKYLESIQKMVDEERRIRDRADREQDVKDKEKKLAMMKMDTSGVYDTDIRALEKELQGDYRDLEDEAIDEAIRQLEEQSDAQAEALDKEIEYMENTLEYKREIMTEYNTWATNLIKSGSDEVMAYLKANDEEYYTGSAAQQQLWEWEWIGMITRAETAHELMAEGLITSVSNSLGACKESADGFKGAVIQYSETALASNGEIEGSVDSLIGYYESLAQGVSGVNNQMNNLRAAYESAAIAALQLKQAQDYVAQGYYESPPPATGNKVKETFREGNPDYNSILPTMEYWGQSFTLSRYEPTNRKATYNGVPMYEFKYTPPEGKSQYVWSYSEEPWFTGAMYTVAGKSAHKKYQFAKGGYVDYTGPAWVDGTKSHPEYMLNATQTQQFETLVAALSSMFTNGNTPISQTSQKIGDAVYNFHINVDQMSSDYDVDQLIDRIEKRLVKAGQYRNVTMVRKTK